MAAAEASAELPGPEPVPTTAAAAAEPAGGADVTMADGSGDLDIWTGEPRYFTERFFPMPTNITRDPLELDDRAIRYLPQIFLIELLISGIPWYVLELFVQGLNQEARGVDTSHKNLSRRVMEFYAECLLMVQAYPGHGSAFFFPKFFRETLDKPRLPPPLVSYWWRAGFDPEWASYDSLARREARWAAYKTALTTHAPCIEAWEIRWLTVNRFVAQYASGGLEYPDPDPLTGDRDTYGTKMLWLEDYPFRTRLPSPREYSYLHHPSGTHTPLRTSVNEADEDTTAVILARVFAGKDEITQRLFQDFISEDNVAITMVHKRVLALLARVVTDPFYGSVDSVLDADWHPEDVQGRYKAEVTFKTFIRGLHGHPQGMPVGDINEKIQSGYLKLHERWRNNLAAAMLVLQAEMDARMRSEGFALLRLNKGRFTLYHVLAVMRDKIEADKLDINLTALMRVMRALAR